MEGTSLIISSSPAKPTKLLSNFLLEATMLLPYFSFPQVLQFLAQKPTLSSGGNGHLLSLCSPYSMYWYQNQYLYSVLLIELYKKQSKICIHPILLHHIYQLCRRTSSLQPYSSSDTLKLSLCCPVFYVSYLMPAISPVHSQG